ncbi:MAG: outer membrane beta-barrel protein [Cellvibrionaceae bacterium]|nr:outer membrane beta-barrel protein [Cellvibrionaceae bacterium]
MNRRQMRRFFRVLLCACTPVTVWAQDAGSVLIGGFELIPALDVQFVEDSNLYQSGDPQSDSLRIISPSLSASFDNGISGFSLGYRLTRADYSSYVDENYTDHLYETAFGWQLNEGHRLVIDGSLLQTHDARSPDAPSGQNASELDKYDDSAVDLQYDWGYDDARLGLTLAAAMSARDYTTNLSSTRERNRSQTELGGSLRFHLLERLTSRVDFNTALIDYEVDSAAGGSRDGSEAVYTLGFSWEMSSQLFMDIDLGVLDRDFDDVQRQGFSTSSWALDLNWSPLARSTVNLASSRATEEPSSGDSDVILRTSAGISWSHEWSRRLRSTLAYINSESDYRGSQREDNADDYAIRVNYQFRRWLDVGVNAQYLEQRSTEVDYDRTRLGLDMAITL